MLKIDIGCGPVKEEGYIGIDRYALPGVDIVADLNNGIPLEDNSVDVVYFGHSLEHFDNLGNILKEIHRVCKNNAIMNVLAPYSNNYCNLVNPNHKLQFNEHTFRYYTNYECSWLDPQLWQFPYYYHWGLASGDYSQCNIDIRCIDMEFFYHNKYNNLSNELKNLARESLNNVCLQILYTLVICKDIGTPYNEDEIGIFKKLAKEYLPNRIKGYLEVLRINKKEELTIFSYFESKINELTKQIEILNNIVEGK